MGIQYGLRPDPFGWINEVVPSAMKAEAPAAQAAAAKP